MILLFTLDKVKLQRLCDLTDLLVNYKLRSDMGNKNWGGLESSFRATEFIIERMGH